MKNESSEQQLATVRRHIDAVDEEILMLLHEREALVGQVAQIKAQYGLEPLQPARYKELLQNLHAKAKELGLKPELVDDIWNAVHEHSVATQKKLYEAKTY
jgi:chorismate mutase